MSIKRTSQTGGIAIFAAIAITLAVGSFGIDRIRLGGPLYQDDKQAADLVADILPPPNYIVEPWLEATLISDEHGIPSEHLAKLKSLRVAYIARRDYWAEQDLPEELAPSLAAAEAESDRFWEIFENEFAPAVQMGDRPAIDAAHEKLGRVFASHRAKIDVLIEKARRHQAKLAADNSASTMWTLALIALVVIALTAMIGASIVFLSKRVLKPIEQTAQTMRRMAQGDLDATTGFTPREDEIGDMCEAIEVFRASAKAQLENETRQRAVVDTVSGGLGELAAGNLAFRITVPLPEEYEALRASYNSTLEQLGSIIEGVSSTARGVSTGASEIRAASDDLALRNEQQAASIEETAAAMNQVTGMVRDSAESAAQVQGSIADAHREATEGGAVVNRAVEAMAGIEQSAQEISQIINVIDGIAFQTNLLALNAGVEAARAGDAGKGFAVVANEVRALAQRSAEAAKDIKELITTSSEQVNGGVALVGQTGALLEKIVARVGEINELIDGIAQSASIQATNLQQVNSAVSDMDRMTQQNAAMVEQSTAAARSLATEAAELAQLVGRFRTANETAASQVSIPSLSARRAAAPRQVSLPTSGNLAIAASEDDWSEF
jgi:methyl-accepting chemotaxis protein